MDWLRCWALREGAWPGPKPNPQLLSTTNVSYTCDVDDGAADDEDDTAEEDDTHENGCDDTDDGEHHCEDDGYR